MRFELFRKEVLNALVIAPFDELGNFISHKVELGACVRHLIQRKRAHTRKLTPIIAWLTANKRAFAVHHFVMRKRQNEILIELIHRRKGKQVMSARTIGKICLYIVKRVVHPAHIPFQMKTEASIFRRISHKRPGGRLFCDHKRFGEVGAYRFIALLHKFDRIEILFGALFVEFLLCRIIHTKIEVQNAGHAIHTDTVDMKFAYPIQKIGDKKAAHLAAAHIKFERAPVGMLFFFEQFFAIKTRKAMRVLAKTTRYPVENNANVLLVAAINKMTQAIGRTIARGGRKIARDLVSPRSIKRMFHERHNLDVRIAHLFYVGYKLIGKLIVAQ